MSSSISGVQRVLTPTWIAWFPVQREGRKPRGLVVRLGQLLGQDRLSATMHHTVVLTARTQFKSLHSCAPLETRGSQRWDMNAIRWCGMLLVPYLVCMLLNAMVFTQ